MLYVCVLLIHNIFTKFKLSTSYFSLFALRIEYVTSYLCPHPDFRNTQLSHLEGKNFIIVADK